MLENSFKHIVKGMVLYNTENLYFFDAHKELIETSVFDFVCDNIRSMTGLYKIGIMGLAVFLHFLIIITSFQTLSNMSQQRRQKIGARWLGFFPFNMLNKLVRGNLYMRLFEVVPLKDIQA